MFLEVIRNNETTQLLTKYILTEERGILLEKQFPNTQKSLDFANILSICLF